MGKQYVVQACIRTEYANCFSKRYCTYRSESSSGTQHTYIHTILSTGLCTHAHVRMCCTVCAHSRFERWYSPIRTVLATWSWDFSRNLPNIQTYVRTYVHTCRQHSWPTATIPFSNTKSSNTHKHLWCWYKYWQLGLSGLTLDFCACHCHWSFHC